MQNILTFHYLGGAVDEVLTTGGYLAAEPARAPLREGFEELLRPASQAKAVAALQLVKGELVGVEVGIIAVQGGFNLFGDRVGERDAAGVPLQQCLNLGGEEVGMSNEQLSVFFLPLMPVGLHIVVFQMCLQMCRFVEEHPEEEVGVEVAVNADFVEGVVGPRPPVIPQLRHPFEGDMEMYFVKVQVVVYPIHR